MKCHDIFDAMWETPQQRKQLYACLANRMGIELKDCHFGHFGMERLKTAYAILRSEDFARAIRKNP